MKHYYRKIQGWFDFMDIYSMMVERFPSGSLFVEIGSWKGMSAVYMGVEIINSKKDIKLVCVDNWKLKDDDYSLPEYANPKQAYIEFRRNIHPVSSVVQHVKKSSVEASLLFKDESLDFVYIDGSHKYEFVKQDLKSWFPKVKDGSGIIAGHDRSFEGVHKAIHEFFGEYRQIMEVGNGSWMVQK
jgi:predicted O-methyltransferase YrrM